MKNRELIIKKLKKFSSKQLLSKLEKGNLPEIEREVSIEILKKRGQYVSKYVSFESAEDVVSVEPTNVITVKPKLDSLKEEVDQFVDSLILAKRDGVYRQVMKSLGGKFELDLDELLEEATEEQLKEALSFKGIGEKKNNTIKSKRLQSIIDEVKEKGKLKSIKLEESEEVNGLKKDSKIKFKPHSRLKIEGEIEGIVLSVYKCHRNNFKEFCKINFNGKIVFKRSIKVKLV